MGRKKKDTHFVEICLDDKEEEEEDKDHYNLRFSPTVAAVHRSEPATLHVSKIHKFLLFKSDIFKKCFLSGNQ